MGLLDTINLGIVGAAGRGSSFKVAVDLIESVRVHAVCDVDVDGLDRASEHLGASEKYLDYEEMLARSEIEAVIIATPMHFPTCLSRSLRSIGISTSSAR